MGYSGRKRKSKPLEMRSVLLADRNERSDRVHVPERRMGPIALKYRSALVIAHPGHELLVYNWLSMANPLVYVLTDGSGHCHKSRLHRTTSILNSLGAQRGSIYGRLTDAEAYSAILAGEVGVFISMAGAIS